MSTLEAVVGLLRFVEESEGEMSGGKRSVRPDDTTWLIVSENMTQLKSPLTLRWPMERSEPSV